MRAHLAEVVMPPEWHAQGLCVGHPDPELWFYENSLYEDVRKLQALRSVEAIEICNDCPVKNLCLKQGLERENMHTGTIWGGLLYSERLRLSSRNYTSKQWELERNHTLAVRKILPRTE